MGVSREHVEKCKKAILFILEDNLPLGEYSTSFLKLKELINANNFTISTSLKELQEEGKVEQE